MDFEIEMIIKTMLEYTRVWPPQWLVGPRTNNRHPIRITHDPNDGDRGSPSILRAQRHQGLWGLLWSSKNSSRHASPIQERDLSDSLRLRRVLTDSDDASKRHGVHLITRCPKQWKQALQRDMRIHATVAKQLAHEARYGSGRLLLQERVLGHARLQQVQGCQALSSIQKPYSRPWWPRFSTATLIVTSTYFVGT